MAQGQYFIIIDENYSKVEEGMGEIDKAKLLIKRGGKVPMSWLGIGVEYDELEFDRRKLVPSKRQLVAYYLLDEAGNCTQISFRNIQDHSIASEFNEQYEKGKAIEESGLKPPVDPMSAIKYLMVIILIILSITAIAMVFQLKSVSKSLVAPLNQSIKEAQQSSTEAYSVCTNAIKILNSTASYVNSSNHAVESLYKSGNAP